MTTIALAMGLNGASAEDNVCTARRRSEHRPGRAHCAHRAGADGRQPHLRARATLGLRGESRGGCRRRRT